MAIEAGAQELKGKLAVICGAGRNIGRMIALTLAAGGAAVVVNARSNRAEAESVVREIEKQGGHALAAVADVTDPVAVEKMITAAAAQFGRIDILVNNAAVRKETPFDTMTASEWREILGVILDGAFN